MSFKIITATERMARGNDVKAVILGPPGIGKTSLLRTLDPKTTLYFDLEGGDLAVQDYPCDQMSPRTWQECRNLACLIGGPDLSAKEGEPYSQAHYNAMLQQNPDINFDKYKTIFIDSITDASRLCRKWVVQTGRDLNAKGKKDGFAKFGAIADEMLDWFNRLQRTPNKDIIFVAIMDTKIDDFGRAEHGFQLEGAKAGKALVGILDEVFTYDLIQFEGEEKPRRAFITHLDNPHGYIAKDRSGRLALYEEPHLGKLLTKIKTQPRQAINHDAAATTTNAQKTGEAA